jgi:GntR family transcriptional regulator
VDPGRAALAARGWQAYSVQAEMNLVMSLAWLQQSITRQRLALYHYCDTVPSMVIRLNPSSGIPIYLQIVEQIRHSIEIGALTEGDQLPAIRTLAEELVVSPNTVVKAYDDLEQEGLIRLRHGAGAYVEKGNLAKSRLRRFREASIVVKEAVRKLRSIGLSDDESRRLFEAEWIEEAAAR